MSLYQRKRERHLSKTEVAEGRQVLDKYPDGLYANVLR